MTAPRHEMLGLAEAGSGDCTAALVDFAQAGASLETHPESLQRKAGCLLQTKDFNRAIAAFEQVRSLKPEDTANLYDLAVAAVRSWRYEGCCGDAGSFAGALTGCGYPAAGC